MKPTRQTEMQRILQLPRPPEPDAAWLDSLHTGTMRLNPQQRQALTCLRALRCLTAPLPVGYGKTLITALAPCALGVPGDRVALLLPPAMIGPFQREVERYDRHFSTEGMGWPTPVSYGKLSARADVLEELAPLVVIADEAHYLRARDSGRTRRVLRYLTANPDVVFVPLSGTLLRRTITDAAHLYNRALGPLSPYPHAYSTLAHLDAVTRLDDARGWPTATDWRAARPLLAWAGEDVEDVDAARRAVRRRVETSPAVVVGAAASCPASLTLRRLAWSAPQVIRDALAHLEATWMLPDHTPITDPMRLASCALQLSQGFYYRWVWGEGGADIPWLQARSTYARELAAYLRRGARALCLDTPGAVAEAMTDLRRADLPPALLDAKHVWDVAAARRPAPPTEAVWLDDSALRRAVADARSNDALVWYAHRAVADRLEELGLEVCRPGVTPSGPRRPLAVSVSSHGTGQNLQTWSANLILSPPASASVWEQLLGRTHRQGQEADEVEAAVLWSTAHQKAALARALDAAVFAAQTTGQQQKLLLANKAVDTPEPDVIG